MALIENIQREDLNPLEEARALERLIAEFGVTHQQAADAVGRSRAAVTNLLRLLELAPEVAGDGGEAPAGHGHMRARCSACPASAQQAEAAQRVVREGLVRPGYGGAGPRAAVTSRTKSRQRQAMPQRSKSTRTSAALQQDLTERLGAKVLIQQASGGKGRLGCAYNSLDELDGILTHIR